MARLQAPTLAASGYSGPGSQGMFGRIQDKYKMEKAQGEVDRAFSVLKGEEDQDNRNILQRATDKINGVAYQPMDEQAAMGVMMQYRPDVYKQIVSEQQKVQAEIPKFQKDAHSILSQMKGMTKEERLSQGEQLLAPLRQKYPMFADEINLDGLDDDEEVNKAFTALDSMYKEEAKSKEGKLQTDFEAGRITEEQRDAGMGNKSAPTIKEFKVGNEIITRQYNEETGKWDDLTKAPRKESDVKSPERMKQDIEIKRSGQPEASGTMDAPDPEATGITGATGLDPNTFMFITGQSSKLPRDQLTRNTAAKNAKEFLKKTGTDLSTFQSQYTAYNDVLTNNIKRYNQTKIMEGELKGTLENLKPVADAISMGTLRPVNVLNAIKGQETLDPEYQQYIFHLQQLKSELAAYNGALQGRPGTMLTNQDYDEAERVIKQGLNSKAAGGLESAVINATGKMNSVLERNIHSTRKAVWDLFGVGEQYDRTHPQKTNDEDTKSLKAGTVEDGYLFKGGDPSDKNNWVKQ